MQDTRPHVTALNGGRAAGRDLYEITALPCPECETRFILGDMARCRHCQHRRNIESAKGYLSMAFLGWLMVSTATASAFRWIGFSWGVDNAYMIGAVLTGITIALVRHLLLNDLIAASARGGRHE